MVRRRTTSGQDDALPTAAGFMEREFGRVEANVASNPPLIISWDPLAGELLRGHLEAEGFPGTTHSVGGETAEAAAPLVLLPPPTYADYLGSGWDVRLRSVPLDVPMVVLARPNVPVRSALQLNLRKSGVALVVACVCCGFRVAGNKGKCMGTQTHTDI